MKTVFIFVTFHTLEQEIERLKKEVASFGLQDYGIYFIDNTYDNKGYAYGVNKGIQKGLADGAEVFVIANPDISLQTIPKSEFFKASNSFDIWGFAMLQNKKTYYGGHIDSLRMSGGLVKKKPKHRFEKTDFISGSFMVIKKKVIKSIGLFDESYFMYYEDVEYCRRAEQAGFRIGVDSHVRYKHFEAARGSLKKEYYLAKNRFRFLFAYGNIRQKLYEFIRLPKTLFEHCIFLVRFFIKKRFIINFFSLNASSLFGKVLNFILFLFLIRFFTPQEYGIYTFVWVHVGILLPLLDLGTTNYSIAYLKEVNAEKLLNIFTLRFILSLIVYAVTVLLAYGFKGRPGYDTPSITYIFLTSVVLFSNAFSGSFFILNALKQKLYISSIVSSVFNTFLTIGLIAVMSFTKNISSIFYALFYLYIAYTFANIILLKKYLGAFRFSFVYKEWLAVAKASFVFVLISLLARIYFKIDIFLLRAIKGDEAVGTYSAGYKFFEALTVMAGSYNMVATPVFAKIAGTKDLLMRKMKKDVLFLSVIGLGAALGGFILSPVLLPFVLKPHYYPAIPVVRIVLFALPCMLVSSVFLNALYVLKKPYVVAFIFLFQVAVNASLNYIFIPKYSYIASSYITVVSELLNFILVIPVFYVFMKKKQHEHIC